MSAKAKHAARFRIEHHQITGCIGSNVSCGFYPRKPVSQRVDHFAVAVFTPHLEPPWRGSQREHMLGSSGKPEQMRSVCRIRRFESCGLHAIATELEDAPVSIADVDGAAGVRHSSKRVRALFGGIGQNSPNLQQNSSAVKHLYPSACGVRNINSSVGVNAESKRALEIALWGDTHRAQWIALGKEQMDYPGVQIRDVDGSSGVNCNGIGGARCGIFKAEQRYAGGFKLLHEAGCAVGKVDSADGIHGRSDGIFKLARFRAAHAPLLDEFDRRKFYHCGSLRVRARAARQHRKKSDQENRKENQAA